MECGATISCYLLSKYQTDQIEAIQNSTTSMAYSNALFLAELTSLTAHREQLTCKFIDCILQPRSCLHHLLPHPRDSLLDMCLDPSEFLRTFHKIKKYQSFLAYMPSATVRPANILMHVMMFAFLSNVVCFIVFVFLLSAYFLMFNLLAAIIHTYIHYHEVVVH